jgi:putative membrane protein
MSKLYQANSVVMLALLAVAGTTIAKDYSKHASTGVPASAQAFMREAAAGGLMEVELGKLAEQQGSETDVKQFGRRMVADHSQANQELQDLASQKDVKLPSALDAKQKAQRDQLAKLSGSAFDRAYMRP